MVAAGMARVVAEPVAKALWSAITGVRLEVLRLREQKFMYDILVCVSAKSTLTRAKFVSPSFTETSSTCAILPMSEALLALSEEDKGSYSGCP